MRPLLFYRKLLLIALLIVSKGYAQSFTKILFIGKQDLKIYNIKEIKEFDNSETDTDYYKLYRFNTKGQLILYADRGLFLSKGDALAGGDKYIYNTTGKLISYEGNGDLGEGHQSNFALYGYNDQKMIFRINGYEQNGRYSSGVELTDVTIYNYSVEGKLVNTVRHLISEKNRNLTMSSLAEIVSKIKNTSQLFQTFIIDKKQLSPRYFFYDQNKIIGYYPIEGNDSGGKIQDTIYSQQKIAELEQTGFKAFSKKYLTETITNKVIADCYRPIKSKDLIINNQPVRVFLSNTNKRLVNNIILEIINNNYLFYKLID